tara:strand:+ start:2275 stop:3711 length:1437 start_codon:yes stop_codon:yes gene_type:complete
MAIIKCDDIEEQEVIIDDEEGAITLEPFVEPNEVSIGKILLAVERTSFSPSTPFVDVLPEVRNADISDTLRADAGLYWYLSEEGKMIHPVIGYIVMVESEAVSSDTGALGMSKTQSKIDIIGHNSYFTSTEQWDAIVDGTDDSRSSPLIPVGRSFEDHAFQMNTPFSKKELEMFANISNTVSVADVESDYDFFDKVYEEGISSTIVPENSLPHLYTEVLKGDSDSENTTEVPEGYFRQWINEIISDQNEMNAIAERYENVAILDSVVNETNDTTSAFEILMSYANRENLFPMNMNVEVDTNSASELMDSAESVGMVDDIVRMLMGDGNVEPVIEPVEEPEVVLTDDVLESSYDMIADSMTMVLQNSELTAAMSDTVVAQVNSMIAAVKDDSWTTDMAQDIQNKFSGINSNGGISPVSTEELTAAIQGLTNLIDSNSLTNNVIQSSEVMNNVAEVNNVATNMATNMVSNMASNMASKYV